MPSFSNEIGWGTLSTFGHLKDAAPLEGAEGKQQE